MADTPLLPYGLSNRENYETTHQRYRALIVSCCVGVVPAAAPAAGVSAVEAVPESHRQSGERDYPEQQRIQCFFAAATETDSECSVADFRGDGQGSARPDGDWHSVRRHRK